MGDRKRVHVAIGIVAEGGRVLICKRREGGTFGGFWEFPGSKCEVGESPADCVRRELWEELEIRVEPARALPPIEYEYPGRLITLHPFLCRMESGSPRAVSAAEFHWAAIGTLREYTFPAANADLIESLVSEGAIDLPAGGT